MVWFLIDLFPKWCEVRHGPEAFLGFLAWFDAG